MKTIRRVSVLIIGALIGYAIANWQHHDGGSGPPPGKAPSSAPAAARSDTGTAAARPQDAVVYVDFYDGQGDAPRRATGVLLGPTHLLILPVSALRRADRAVMTDARGRQHPLSRVLGADLDEGLAAVATTLPSGPVLSLPASDGTLYLGREVTVFTPDGGVKGWVDSAALQRDDGMTYYKVRVSEALHADNAALVDPQTGKLIGITLAGTANPLVYEAVDATAIGDLTGGLQDSTPRSLAAFGRYYAEHTTQGGLENLKSLAQAHKWNALIREGRDLLNGPADNDQQVRGLLERAYEAIITTALNKGRMDGAVNLLDEAGGLLGDSAPRLRLRAAVAQSRGDFEQARSLLHDAMNLNPGLSDAIANQIRELVRTAVLDNGRLTTEQKVQLLESELAENPDDAVYHQLLGQLYYRRAAYQQAVDQLTRAVTLDNQLEARLAPLIDKAQQRLSIPGLTDAPLYGTDHNYTVEVRINDHDEPLSFMLDTGSTYTAISRATARRLGINVPSTGPMTPLQTANGIIEAPVITLQTVTVNGAAVNDIDVAVVKSLGQYDGLLGLSYLSHFDFNINQSEHKLTLKRH